MDQETVMTLKKERNALLNEYMNAAAKDKIKILVKIMDIDDRLEDISKKYAIL